MPLLDVHELSVSFGAVHAVRQVSLAVEPGTLVGLIGSNGAGKTTMLDALTGFVPATGSATFDGVELLDLPAHRRTALGMSRTWQTVELFDDLTVYENLCVASSGTRVGRVIRSFLAARPSHDRDAMTRVMSDLELDDVLERYPEELSEGERKLVGLARTLMARPQLILADEPAAGLDSDQSVRLGHRLRDLVSKSLTILLVDHDMGLVLSVCDLIYVLDHGVLIASGTPDEIRKSPEVLAAYLGEAQDDLSGNGYAPAGRTDE
jgi:branched-chain amino acid transport system ATP-binding protein